MKYTKAEREQRLQLLDRCDELLKNCNDCQIKLNNIKNLGSAKADSYCKVTCEIGLELQDIGKVLHGGTFRKQKENFSRRTKRDKNEVMEQVREMRAAGKPYKDIAAEIDIHLPTLYRWRKEYNIQ